MKWTRSAPTGARSSAALLEVLDPAQNTRSGSLPRRRARPCRRCSSSPRPTWPTPFPALFDRMEVIRFDGLHHREKVAIARGHLCRQVERTALRTDEVTIDAGRAAPHRHDYTREAVSGSSSASSGHCSGRPPPDCLGQPRRAGGDRHGYGARRAGPHEVLPRGGGSHAVPGVATGLAVTGVGGDVLFVEQRRCRPGRARADGQLGDVMRESARIALTYVKSHAPALGIDERALDGASCTYTCRRRDPKDGPSAGARWSRDCVAADAPARQELHRHDRQVTLQAGASHRRREAEGVAAHAAGLTQVISQSATSRPGRRAGRGARAHALPRRGSVDQVLALALEPRTGEGCVASAAARRRATAPGTDVTTGSQSRPQLGQPA